MKVILGGIVFFFILSASPAGYAQPLSGSDTSESPFFLRKELAFRIMAHSSGFGFGLYRSHSPTVFTKRIYEAEILNMKAGKEIRTVYPFADDSKSYIYGKQNYVFLIRAGMGYEHLINRKPRWGGVEVRYLYHAGISVAFAKPIYLLIINYSPASDDYYISTEKYDPDLHFYDNIYGRAGFSYGFSEMKVHPGLYGRFGFQFDFGRDNDRVRALEAGIVLDAYPEAVRIMAFNDPTHFFTTFYLTLNLGKRYNREKDILKKED